MSFILLFSFEIFADPCSDLVKTLLQPSLKNSPQTTQTADVVLRLKQFADEHQLPYQILDVGPKQRLVKKLFVGLDMTDEKLVAAYLKRFNIEDPKHPTLALEFGYEVPTEYVSGVLRTSPDPKAPIYRWGQQDIDRDEWAWEWMVQGGSNYKGKTDHPERLKNPVWGYAHLLGINEKEARNVQHFLDNPLERGPCKSDNCIAWMTGIELGQTAKTSTDEERKYLFNELGISRSSAHFEIGRRLMHAANQRHAAVVVFVNGESGRKAFKQNLKAYLPPEPQIPYTTIIKGLGHDPDGELMKAVGTLPDGAKIFFPIAAGASPEAMSALIQQAPKLKKGYDISILVNGISESTLRQGAELHGGKVRFKSFFIGGNMRKLHHEDKIEYIPGYLSDFPRFMRDPTMKGFKYDVLVVRVSPPNKDGYHSLGPNYDMIDAVLESNPNIKILAEVNQNIPFTNGKNQIHASKISKSFASKAKLAGPPVVPFTKVEGKIGMNIAKLIDDNAVLQVGIGNVFGGLPIGLKKLKRSGLSISSEMFGDSLKEIMEMGIAKKAETGFAYGSEDLYAWLNRNKQVTFVPTSDVNSPAKVESTPKFHAVNTALQVKLTGDVNAEFGPEGRLSSPGGQVEFMSGASRSIGGKSIIAIRSTAKEGELSTIVLDMYGGKVTTPAESVHYVVTEYGIATLKGKSKEERAIELINVAHPKFREQLMKDALESHLITPADSKAIKLNVQELAATEMSPNEFIKREIASEKLGWFSQFMWFLRNLF